MSIDINWEALTGGTDRTALAESIRTFVNEKFQEVTLPRFIRSVHVHSFEFGDVSPEVVLKDICDPLPDFYQDDEHCKWDDAEEANGEGLTTSEGVGASRERAREEQWAKTGRKSSLDAADSGFVWPTAHLERLGLRANIAAIDQPSPFLSRAPTPGITPGITGGTSNLGYFHLPLGAGLSGTATPLAAFAGAHFSGPRLDYFLAPTHQSNRPDHDKPDAHMRNISHAPSLIPGRSDLSQGVPSRFTGDSSQPRSGDIEVSLSPSRSREPSAEDVQVVSRLTYKGNIKLSLTAEILLDYPMPSFAGIPLKLNITGMAFDGVAVLAYIKKRAHFCFLSPEDAEALVSSEGAGETAPRSKQQEETQSTRTTQPGGLLQEIRVESEIGQKENGKQVLKNVGKVERFVLERVRKIFDDEFVYPSFWTFLL